MHNSPFSVAGMSTSTSAHHHNPNVSGWGSTSVNPSGPLTSSFSDSLSQSRSQYQPGYLMSASQNINAQQGSPRADDVPIVQTKAKMNQMLVRGKTAEFGMDSMFESSRKRQTLADEDAPPMSSVVDIPNETYVDSTVAFQPRASILGNSSLFRHRPRSGSTTTGTNSGQHSNQQILYIIVFGYPSDRYSVTVEYFKSLGESTDPDLNNEIANCFRIGYHDPGDAMRAVRKNGEVLGGCYMVGVKWADPALAEALLGQAPLLRSTTTGPMDTSLAYPTSPGGAGPSIEPATQHGATTPGGPGANTPSFGTPIKLAPSAAAFRKASMAPTDKAPPSQSQAGLSLSRSWVPGVPGAHTAGGSRGVNAPGPGAMRSPAGVGSVNGMGSVGGAGAPVGSGSVHTRGVLGQVSDLIFGW